MTAAPHILVNGCEPSTLATASDPESTCTFPLQRTTANSSEIEKYAHSYEYYTERTLTSSDTIPLMGISIPTCQIMIYRGEIYT